jgi:SpoVK/Ycf46/Vps4 family AAA+-type ATPase
LCAGKTLIGKAIAHETGATFFSISASSLTSKWIGEGEAGVRTLFALAAFYQPSVVFIDEVDSLLSQRSSEENEASRRIKTEFLIQLDGVGGSRDARVVIIGATNRPQELDEAARRRFVKRIYIPLPDKDSRVKIIENLLRSNKHRLDKVGVDFIAERTSGFSGADMSALCTEAAMCPLRELASKHMGDLRSLRESDVPPINREHFEEALQSVSCSVSQGDLQQYVDWNALYGTYKRME